MGGHHHPFVVGSDDTVDGDVLAQGRDRLRCRGRIRAVDLEIAIAHVERWRLLRGDHQVYTQGFCGFDEVGGAVCVRGEDYYSFGHLGFGDRPTTIFAEMSDSTVLTIAPDALDMIRQLRDNEPGDGEFALSIEVTGFQGPQFSYELAFAPLADKAENWVEERHDGLAVMFPKADAGKLEGAALELTEQGLAMNNPNSPATPDMAAAPAGDLSGPLVDRVQQVIKDQVNPAIAAHGGGAELVSVDGTIAYLRLFGGCQGCGLAQVTLKQGIERILLESIPELSQVVDVTDHASGDDPYYESQKK